MNIDHTEITVIKILWSENSDISEVKLRNESWLAKVTQLLGLDEKKSSFDENENELKF
jgi:hypothetical protein